MKTILVVEDDLVTANAYQRLLQEYGFEVDLAADGEIAIQTLQTLRPDLVLLDLMLPKVPGTEVIRSIRSNPAIQDVPILVFTNALLTAMIKLARQAGANLCLTKGDTTLEQLLQAICGLLNIPVPSGAGPVAGLIVTTPAAATPPPAQLMAPVQPPPPRAFQSPPAVHTAVAEAPSRVPPAPIRVSQPIRITPQTPAARPVLVTPLVVPAPAVRTPAVPAPVVPAPVVAAPVVPVAAAIPAPTFQAQTFSTPIPPGPTPGFGRAAPAPTPSFAPPPARAPVPPSAPVAAPAAGRGFRDPFTAAAPAAPPSPPPASKGASKFGANDIANMRTDMRQAFLEGAPQITSTLRGRIPTYVMTKSEVDYLPQLFELYQAVDGVSVSAGIAGFTRIELVATALQSLLRELFEEPENITASSLRTAAHASELLATLFERASYSTDSMTPALVLAVDDEVISRRAVGSALEAARLKHVIVDDPEIALRLCVENRFDLIFSDVEMPGKSGFDMCAELRTLPLNKTTPLVFITSLSGFESRARSALAGGNDLIAKPFLLTELAVKALTYLIKNELKEKSAQAGIG